MARARNIKPSFFQNDVLGELAPIDRLAFIGMWTIADFKGCLEHRPKRLKAQLLPYDDCDFEVIANNLDKSGFVRIYSVQGQRYIKIINFDYWVDTPKSKFQSCKDTAARRARKRKAVPIWADKSAIKEIYKHAASLSEKGGEWHVDHVIPLAGKNVCGLHTEANLKVVKAIDNLKKSNKMMGDHHG